MKYVVYVLLVLIFSQSAFSGVGGSTGGKGEKISKLSLIRYSQSRRFNVVSKNIIFEAQNGFRRSFPVSDICLYTHDTFRTINEETIPVFDKNNQVFGNEKTYLFAPRSETLIHKKLRIFKPAIESKEVIEIPLEQVVEIWTTERGEKQPSKLIKTLVYKIEDCP